MRSSLISPAVASWVELTGSAGLQPRRAQLVATAAPSGAGTATGTLGLRASQVLSVIGIRLGRDAGGGSSSACRGTGHADDGPRMRLQHVQQPPQTGTAPVGPQLSEAKEVAW